MADEESSWEDSIEKVKDNLKDFGNNVKEKFQGLKLGEKTSNLSTSIGVGVRSVDWGKLNPGRLGLGEKGKKVGAAVGKRIKNIKKPDLSEIDEFEERISPYLPTEIAKKWIQKHHGMKIDTKKNVVLDWTKIYSWSNDPFSTDVPKRINEHYIINKAIRNKLSLFLIKKQKFGTIIGEGGTGKTALCHWLMEELGHHKGKVYASYLDPKKKIKTEGDLVKLIIKPLTSMYEKVFTQPHQDLSTEKIIDFIKKRIKTKNLFLIVDDPDKIPERYHYVLQNLYQSDKINVQLIIAGTKDAFKGTIFNKKDFNDQLKITLNEASDTILKQILEKRMAAVGGHKTFPFEDNIIKAIAKKAKGNPVSFLTICREKAMKMSLDQRDKIIERIAEIKKQQEEEKEQQRELRRKAQVDGATSSMGKIQTFHDNINEGVKRLTSGKSSRSQNEVFEDKQIDEIDNMLAKELDAALKSDRDESEQEYDNGKAMQENDTLIAGVTGSHKEEKQEKQKSNKEMEETDAEIEKLIKQTNKQTNKQKEIRGKKDGRCKSV